MTAGKFAQAKVEELLLSVFYQLRGDAIYCIYDPVVMLTLPSADGQKWSIYVKALFYNKLLHVMELAAHSYVKIINIISEHPVALKHHCL
jgi:Na+-transporting methylmalonyl-CoA/oxaloacetate decarboxylase beta subunit